MYVSIYLSDCLSISLSLCIYIYIYLSISTTSPHVCWLNHHFCLYIIYISLSLSFRYSYYVHTIVEAFSFREATLKWMALSMIDFRSCERLEIYIYIYLSLSLFVWLNPRSCWLKLLFLLVGHWAGPRSPTEASPGRRYREIPTVTANAWPGGWARVVRLVPQSLRWL